MTASFSRRDLIVGVGAVSAATCLLGTSSAAVANDPVVDESTSPRSAKMSDQTWPRWDSRDETALLDVLQSGNWGRTRGGHWLKDFEAAFAEKMRARYCIATASGTAALLTTLAALGIGPGDEVIMPPYTFVATFNAITNSYALPVFVDSDAETFQIDPTKIAPAITPATKLLLPVHIGGSPADMNAIGAVAKSHKLSVIEDACQAPLAELNDQPVGTFGLGGCFSFQASKNLTSGEGGAVLTNDEAFFNQCYNFHTPGGSKLGTSSGRGSNYRMTEFQASLLLAQLTRLEVQAKTRDANAAYLTEMLRKIPGITPARLVNGCTRSGWHLYMFRYDQQHFSKLSRARFIEELSKVGVGASGGYTSLNRSSHVRALAENPHYQRLYGEGVMKRWLESSSCLVNDRLCEEAVWLSQTKLLGSRIEMERIAEVVARIQKHSGELARAV